MMTNEMMEIIVSKGMRMNTRRMMYWTSMGQAASSSDSRTGFRS
jgi:hypothetical protein